MFRVNSYQAVLRVVLASAGLMVCGAVAQDNPNDHPNQVAQDQKSPEKPTQDAVSAAPASAVPTQSAQAQPATDAADPLKLPRARNRGRRIRVA